MVESTKIAEDVKITGQGAEAHLEITSGGATQKFDLKTPVAEIVDALANSLEAGTLESAQVVSALKKVGAHHLRIARDMAEEAERTNAKNPPALAPVIESSLKATDMAVAVEAAPTVADKIAVLKGGQAKAVA